MIKTKKAATSNPESEQLLPAANAIKAYERVSKHVGVTIILTNFNHSRYLDCSLSAIVDQTRPADEIIVIDDGSTDNSLEIIERYARKHLTIRVIKNEQNRGVQYSIARALGAATSEWIVWAAADDQLLPDFLQRGIEMIQRFPNIGVVFSQLATFQEDTLEIKSYTGNNDPLSAFFIGEDATPFSPEKLMERLALGYLWLSGNTALCRRKYILDVGAFIPSLEWHSDWFSFYAVALRYGACGIPQTLAAMRVVPDTYSAAGMRDTKRQMKVMLAIIDVLRRPEFLDLRAKFRARPCLFSPFPAPMLKTLLRRPQDWDLLIRLLGWALNHQSTIYRNRLNSRSFSTGVKTRVLHRMIDTSARVVDWITPSAWKADLS